MSTKSLRFQIAAISAAILIVLSIILSIMSIYQAENIFIWPDYEALQAAAGSSDALLEDLLLQEMNALQMRFRMQVLAIMLVGILLGVFLIHNAIAKLMKPLQKFIHTVEITDETRLATPLPIAENQAAEIRSLTQSFNHMLAKLAHAFQTQKRFSQNVAHELKTPVAAMMMQIDVAELSNDLSSDDYRQTLNTVKTQVEHLDTIVSSMLALHAQNDDLALEPIKIHNLVAALLQGQAALLKAKKLQVETKGEMVIVANGVLIERVFANLIQNAIRYNRFQGSISIRMNDAEFTIANDSAPVSQADLQAIFEPFYCVDQSRSKASGGYGLGLSISKQILETYGLDIHAEYVDGRMLFAITKQNETA